MQEQLISFETAKLAKYKGFRKTSGWMGFVDKFYHPRTGTLLSMGRTGKTPFHTLIYAPTQSLLQRWLREVHKIQIVVHPILVEKAKSPIKYDWYILYDVNKDAIESKNLPLHTYETALEIALQEALKLIK